MRYNNSNILKTNKGKRYYNTILYPLIKPDISDIYVITTAGDRLDILANDFYKDPTMWWIIASANNLRKDSIYIQPGTQLRIPTNLVDFNIRFNNINKNR